MKRTLVLTCGLLMAISAASADDSKGGNKVPKMLEFRTMIGVPRPYTGATNAIRGVNGGGLPWVVGSAKGELSVDGYLEVKIQGLVFDPNDAAVQAAGLANQNTVGSFRAIVSCLTVANGTASTVNVMTDPFPATTGFASAGGGDAKIEAWLNLPKPCIAPIVFVASPGGSWFASTGN